MLEQELGHFKVKLLHSLVQRVIHAQGELLPYAQLVQCVLKGHHLLAQQALPRDQQLTKTLRD